MDPETERRIEEARLLAERERQTKEFLEGLTKNDDIVKPVYNPEAFVMRSKVRAAAGRGELPKPWRECTHPLMQVRVFQDTDPGVLRNSKPVNLFCCGICECPLWLTDPWGAEVSDN